MNNTLRIKNDSAVARSIRPYMDRGVLVTIQPSEVAEIDLRKTGWDVKKNPIAYFRMLGFTFAAKSSPKPQTSAADTPPTITRPAPADATVTPNPEPVKTPETVEKTENTQAEECYGTDEGYYVDIVKFSAEKGNVKHFHPGNKLWHTIRNVKEWVLGKVIYNEEMKSYFRVNSLDGDLMVCTTLTEEEAVKITGVRP